MEVVEDLEDAMAQINQSPYGLSNSIFTANKDNFEKMYVGTRSGLLNYNRSTNGASGMLPFGGVGKSGNQRAAGIDAVRYSTFPVAIQEKECGDVQTPALLQKPFHGLASQLRTEAQNFAGPARR